MGEISDMVCGVCHGQLMSGGHGLVHADDADNDHKPLPVHPR